LTRRRCPAGLVTAAHGDTLQFNAEGGVDGYWETVAGYDNVTHVLCDEMFSFGAGYLNANDAVGQWHWTITDADEGVFYGIAGEANHPGIVRIETTGAATPVIDAGGGDTAGSGTSVVQISIDDIAWVRLIVRIPTVESNDVNADYGIGLVQNSTSGELGSSTPNLGGNGLILFKANGTANWLIRDENASAGTNSDTGRAAALSDWIECILTNEGGGTWGVVINGTAIADHTGAPTGVLVYPAAWINSSDAVTNNFFDVDHFSIGLRAAGNRYS
jgi:hypothetical protein